MQPNKDLYQLLGLPSEASEDDIQRAHRKLVREYHPDTNPKDPRSEERFKDIQQAYEILSDDQKRREYDQRFHTSSREGSGRPRAGGSGGKTGGDAAQGTDKQRAHQDRGPMFTLGYFSGIVLVALMVALLILLILGLD